MNLHSISRDDNGIAMNFADGVALTSDPMYMARTRYCGHLATNHARMTPEQPDQHKFASRKYVQTARGSGQFEDASREKYPRQDSNL
jgi:hypothetical protein